MGIGESKYSIIRAHFGEIENYQPRILRVKSVCQLMGVSRSSVYNWINANSRWFIPSFPKPVRIGNAAIGWLEDELIEYMRSSVRAGSAS